MQKVTLTIRVNGADLEDWRKRSIESGQTLSEWIRERLNVQDWSMNEIAKKAGHVKHNPAKKQAKRCRHGIEQRWHCWQCGGLAVVERGEKGIPE